MEYQYGAISGPRSGYSKSMTKSKDLAAADNNNRPVDQIRDFSDLLMNRKCQSYSKPRDLATADNTNRKVDQITIFRKLLFKGIY
jgi:hypothetical protein